jgi:hypothetical protein
MYATALPPNTLLQTLQKHNIIYVYLTDPQVVADIPANVCTRFRASIINDLDKVWVSIILRKNSRWFERVNFEVTLRMPAIEYQVKNDELMKELC